MSSAYAPRIRVGTVSARARLNAETLYMLTFSDRAPKLPTALKDADSRADGRMGEFLKRAVLNEKKPSLDSTFLGLPDVARFAVVSVGPKDRADLESVRVAGALITKHLKTQKTRRACVATANVESVHGSVSAAITEGLLLADFRYEEHLSKKCELPQCRVDILPQTPAVARSASRDVRQAVIAANGTNLARWLGHQPPNQINPPSLARLARSLAKENGLRCSVLTETQMEKQGMGGILAVGQASNTPPRLIVLQTGHTAKGPPVVLVGKAVTFDTGGYSIKPASGMLGMKYDKCGGTTVLALMVAAAKMRIRVPLVGVIAAAENMIGGNAYRPNDIIRTLSGKTVEITNTDAEGRMVLADALTYAQRKFAPREVIDLATLTGGAVVSLGHTAAALFSNDDDMIRGLTRSGERVHERVWQLPMWDEYDALMKGTDSDLVNSSKDRAAHCIQGAVFLKQFIEPGTRWTHLDIAGTATTDNGMPYCPQGATGFGVRLLLDYLRDLR